MKKLIILFLALGIMTGCNNAQSTVKIDMKKAEEVLKGEEQFKEATTITEEELKNIYDLDTNLLEEYIVLMPKIADQANMYMILKPKAGKKEEVRNQLNLFTEKYIEQFNLYQPEEADKINRKLISLKGDYIIYIISDNNQEILKKILQS